MDGTPRALEGLKVADVSVYAAGPMIAKHLGEQGAQVVHIESRTRPDGFRVHYPPYKDNIPGLNRTGSFALFNDSKLGITLNLKTEGGVAIAKRIAAWADVLIENFVPGVMERLGLGYQTLRRINPALVYISSCNMGQTGPMSSKRGFGSQLTSQSGFTFLAGYDDDDPTLLFGPYIDFVAVGYGLIAVLAALDYRRRHGTGQYIDLSQYETGVQFVIPALLDYQANERVMTRAGNRDPRLVPHNAYRCRGDDRWCAIAVLTEDEWRALCHAADHPEWIEDARFATFEARKKNESELDALLGEWTLQFDARLLMEKLQAAGVPAGVVNSIGDLFCDPQLAHRGIWRELPHAELGTFHYEAPPFDLLDTPAYLSPSPLLGEHNHYVLSELLGMSEQEIQEYQSNGVIE